VDQRDAACDTKQWSHQNWQDPQERHRRAHHAASRLWYVAITPIFGWGKQHGTMRKTKHRVIARVAARRRPCLAVHRTWQRRYLRAAMPRPWLAAFRGELVRPDLLCGRATRASTYFLLPLARGELLHSPNVAEVACVPVAQTWTTFDGTKLVSGATDLADLAAS
jgi:hypothetical protein